MMSVYTIPHRSIKCWAEEDRPREKLLSGGARGLSDSELLAILLRSGSSQETVLGLARRILDATGNDLGELGRLSLAELCRFKGVGEAKAVTLLAALELGRRRQLSKIREKPQVTDSEVAYEAIAPMLLDLAHEEFWLLLLNRANRIIGRTMVSQGGTAGTVVDPKMVFRKALDGGASAIILCHNHPSGTLSPSTADIVLTKKLRAAGQVLEITVLDHLIVTGRGYYSFLDHGRIRTDKD